MHRVASTVNGVRHELVLVLVLVPCDLLVYVFRE